MFKCRNKLVCCSFCCDAVLCKNRLFWNWFVKMLANINFTNSDMNYDTNKVPNRQREEAVLCQRGGLLLLSRHYVSSCQHSERNAWCMYCSVSDLRLYTLHRGTTSMCLNSRANCVTVMRLDYPIAKVSSNVANKCFLPISSNEGSTGSILPAPTYPRIHCTSVTRLQLRDNELLCYVIHRNSTKITYQACHL